jgi:hypothetical protein
MTLDERIARVAARMNADDSADLLEGWRYFKTAASDEEIEQFVRRLESAFPEPLPAREDVTRESAITQRVLRNAALLPPQRAADLLRSWRDLQTVFTEAELEQMHKEYRAERREEGRQELQRLFELGGNCGDQ